MATRKELLARIDAFLQRHRMTERQFGLGAVGNHRLVQRLRQGFGVTLTVIEKAEAFMARADKGHQDPGEAA
jgi:hypothetical protein